MRLVRLALAFGLLATLATGGEALAHRLNLFAFVEDTTIRGSAYYAGGGAAEGAMVTAFGPDGAVVGRMTTDAEGAFALVATMRADHRLVVETVDGHSAEFSVAAAELPTALPGPDGGADAIAGSVAAGTAGTVGDGPAVADAGGSPSSAPVAAAPVAAAPVAAAPVTAIDEAALEALIADAVRRQIQPLRAELAASREVARWSDILGGIGYIAGIFGILAFLMARRRAKAGPMRQEAQSAPATVSPAE